MASLERERCAADVLHFVRNWCWTYDPRLEHKYLPFDLFEVQEGFLSWLRERERLREPGLAEKSRDMGVTWACVAYALHGWLFRPGFSCGFGSRKLELVDELGNPDSIMEKARIILDFLPEFLKPRGFKRAKHAMHCRIVNPVTGATLVGEGGDDIGRGGRQALYFVDEAAHLKRPDLIDASLSNTTNCRIDVSTPRGVGNPFWRKRFSGAMSVYTLHWKQDPRKDQAWYEKQCLLHDAVTVAQEIDIDYTASVTGVAIPAAWVQAAVNLPLRRAGDKASGLDVSAFGKDACCQAHRHGSVVDPLEQWAKANTTETAWRAAELSRRFGDEFLYYDVCGLGEGVRGTWDSAEEKLPFRTVPVNAGESPTETIWPDKRSSKEMFGNRRSEMWWVVRERFEKTFERVRKGVDHPDDECISIPSDPELIAELSQPESRFTSSGKILLESKEEMKKRGLKSPNRADALVLCFHPRVLQRKGTWRMERL